MAAPDQWQAMLTLQEAADAIRCSKAHVSHLINGKVARIRRLPSIRVGRRVLIRRESLQDWLGRLELGGDVLSSGSQHSAQETPERGFHA